MSNGATGTITVPVRVITYPSEGTTTNSVFFKCHSSREIDNTNNTGSGTVSIPASTISGTVYRDINDDGILSGAGETGISGITVTLNGTAFDATSVARTTTTDSSGNFSFAGLPEGAYSLTEGSVSVSGFVDGRETAGTIDGIQTGDTSVNEVISGITPGENKAGINYLFGETPGITISGSVLNDTDAGGTSNAGDTAIASVTMTLTGTNDRGQAVNCAITTDANGLFSFTAANCANLRAGGRQFHRLYADANTACGLLCPAQPLSGRRQAPDPAPER